MGLPRDYVKIDEEQFAKLVELLTPGYELAKAYVEEMRARNAAMQAAQQVDGMDQTQELDPDGNPPTGGNPGQKERTTSADDESQKGGG